MTQKTAPQASGSLRRVLAIAEGPDELSTLAAALEFAAQHDAALYVLACVERPKDVDRLSRSTGVSTSAILDRMMEDRQSVLLQLCHEAGASDVRNIRVTVGKPFLEICRHVVAEAIDVVVKTAEQLPGGGRFLFASTDQHLIRKCPCAIWLRLPDAKHPPQTILAAVDVDDWDASEPETLIVLNNQIIEMAINLAGGPETIIHVLHVWDAPGEGLAWTFSTGSDPRGASRRYLRDVEKAHAASLERLISPFRSKSQETGGPTIIPRLARGPVRSVIAEQAEILDSDILVMGTVARTSMSGILIGNTAEDILNTVDCSVMTVKPKAFVSPLDLEPN